MLETKFSIRLPPRQINTMVPIAIMFALFAVILTVIYYFSQRKFDYWSKQKIIPYLKPTPILGTYEDYVLQKVSLAEMAQKCCQQYPEEPLVGAFCLTEPVLLVQDPELIKLVMTKDFYFFSCREVSDHTHKEILTKNLFFNHGDTWRVVRQNLTPLFTSAKMKNMFHLIENCTRDLEKLLDREIKKSNVIEIRSLMARFTMDCICSAAFGIDANAMVDTAEPNPFQRIGDAIFCTTPWRGVKVIARRYWPGIFYALGFKVYPDEIYRFFADILSNVFESRNNMPSFRQDFVDLILSLKKNEHIVGDSIHNLKDQGDRKVNVKVDNDLLMAQCTVFFAAGFETSATSLGFVLYELAKQPEVQDKVLKEIDAYFSTRNKVEYDCLTELPYLEQCLDESSRLYPVLGVIMREVYDTYKFPNGVHVDKGIRVHIPVYHVHRNPKYFPDPEQFKPERFSPENKKNIKPYTFMPFGEGPRICIGLRFAKMQMIAGIVTLLKKFKVELADDMPRKLRLEPRALVSVSDIGIKLKVIERDGWEKRVYGAKLDKKEMLHLYLGLTIDRAK